jgi:hypothetical protein
MRRCTTHIDIVNTYTGTCVTCVSERMMRASYSPMIPFNSSGLRFFLSSTSNWSLSKARPSGETFSGMRILGLLVCMMMAIVNEDQGVYVRIGWDLVLKRPTTGSCRAYMYHKQDSPLSAGLHVNTISRTLCIIKAWSLTRSSLELPRPRNPTNCATAVACLSRIRRWNRKHQATSLNCSSRV